MCVIAFRGLLTNFKVSQAECGIKEEPDHLSETSVKFLVYTARKIDFYLKWAFLDYKSSFNSQAATKWYASLQLLKRGALYFFSLMCYISKSQGRNIDNLAPVGQFPDDNSNLNSWMAMKWHIQLLGAWKKVSRGYLSNLNFARAENSIWISFEISRPLAATKSLIYALFQLSKTIQTLAISPLGNQIYHWHQDTHWYDFAKETIFSWFINGRIDSKTKCFYHWFLYKWHIFFREQVFCVWYVNPCLIVASCITILPSSDGICAFLTKKTMGP